MLLLWLPPLQALAERQVIEDFLAAGGCSKG
jgi:hypothetical protein